MVALGPLVSDNVHGPHQKAVFEPGMAYPLSDFAAYLSSLEGEYYLKRLRQSTRDELFIKGRLD